MLDWVKMTVSAVGVIAICVSVFLGLNAPGGLFEELMWLFSIACFAMGALLLIWQLKGKYWLKALITWTNN
ncbi:hypothetical protein [Marinobacterium sp. BA1]|uniref:hypothetical protein n=1 Tax=Marinobacterium sp. BA1 TaxID=3138931 RepID=UPI0032E6D4B5